MGIAAEKPWDIRDLVWGKTAGSVATDGVYMKTELMIGGVKHYLKLSSYDSFRGIFGHESVNEFIAGRLGELLGFDVLNGSLRKSLVRIEGKDYETYVFLAESYKSGHSRVAFEDFYVDNRSSDEESPLDFCIRYGWGMDIFKMFIFDYLIINRDRHGANLEVLKDKGVKLSPLFDNGLSFVCSCTDEADLEVFDAMDDRPVNNFIGTKRLGSNLKLIDRRMEFAALCETDGGKLFAGLGGVLPERYFDVIWGIIWGRWQDVKKFRVE